MTATIPKFKAGTTVHAAISVLGKRVKRDGHNAVCGLPLAGTTRLAPHHNINREPPITCDICLKVTTAFADFCGV